MARKTRRDEQAQQTRAHILDTALRLFSERGYRGTSTRRIAREAGVSEGLIFHHFARKRDLLAGIGEARGVLAKQIFALLDTAREVPAQVVVPAIGSRFVEMVSADDVQSRLFRVMLAESHTDPELRGLFLETSGQVVVAIARYLDARVAAGELRADLPTTAAAQNLLGSMLWYFLTTAVEDPKARRAAVTTYSQQVVDVWLHGALAAHPAGGASTR